MWEIIFDVHSPAEAPSNRDTHACQHLLVPTRMGLMQVHLLLRFVYYQTSVSFLVPLVVVPIRRASQCVEALAPGFCLRDMDWIVVMPHQSALRWLILRSFSPAQIEKHSGTQDGEPTNDTHNYASYSSAR